MDQNKNEFEQAVSEAQSKLNELESELAGIPALVKAAAAQAMQAQDERTILARIKERKRLEERQEVLPILIRHARIAVLNARAASDLAIQESALEALPGAKSEEAEAKAALEAAQLRYSLASATTQQLTTRADNASYRRRSILSDVDNLRAGKPTNHYFTN